MSKISKTCYMCKDLATSVEHVPPKCIFPEAKDLPDGGNLKKQLFTVPACHAHNSCKSNDDEYFFYVLTTNLQINKIGRNQYNTKIKRAIARAPNLIR